MPDLRCYVLTCGARVAAGVTRATLDSILRSDWGDPPVVCVDEAVGGDPKANQTENYRRVLERVAADRPDYALVLEDDVAVSRHLRANLEQWEPVRDGRAPLLGILYNPTLAPRADAPPVQDGFVVDAGSVYGSQAFLITPDVADYCLQHWLDVPALQDIKMSRLAARMDPHALVVHTPSLVEHVESGSTHGAGHHTAADFDPWWRAGDGAAPALRWDEVPGWFDWPCFYEQQVRALSHGSVVVEVGTLLGRSIIYLAQTMKAARKDLRLFAVDTFTGSPSDPAVLHLVEQHGGSLRAAFEANLERAGAAEAVTVMPMDSLQAAREFCDASVDLLFLDGDHAEEAVVNDLLWWLSRLRPGGVVAGHDINTYPSVGRALDRMLGRGRYHVDHGQNLWVWRKG